MKLEYLLLSAFLGIGAASAVNVENNLYAAPQEKEPRLNPFITSSVGPDLKQGLKVAKECSRTSCPEGRRLFVDGTVALTYTGAETVRGPFSVQYSVCFGPPAQDEDVTGTCAGGGKLGTIDSFVTGEKIEFELHAKTYNSFVPRKDNKKGDRTMLGLTPHITVTITEQGKDIYQEHILLKPIGEYK